MFFNFFSKNNSVFLLFFFLSNIFSSNLSLFNRFEDFYDKYFLEQTDVDFPSLMLEIKDILNDDLLSKNEKIVNLNLICNKYLSSSSLNNKKSKIITLIERLDAILSSDIPIESTFNSMIIYKGRGCEIIHSSDAHESPFLVEHITSHLETSFDNNRIYMFTGDACDRGLDELNGYGALINIFTLLLMHAWAKIEPEYASVFSVRGNHDASLFISSRAGGKLWHERLKILTNDENTPKIFIDLICKAMNHEVAILTNTHAYIANHCAGISICDEILKEINTKYGISFIYGKILCGDKNKNIKDEVLKVYSKLKLNNLKLSKKIEIEIKEIIQSILEFNVKKRNESDYIGEYDIFADPSSEKSSGIGFAKINCNNPIVFKILLENKYLNLGINIKDKKIVRLVGHSNDELEIFYDKKYNQIIPVIICQNSEMKLIEDDILQDELDKNGIATVISTLFWDMNLYEKKIDEKKIPNNVLMPILIFDFDGNCYTEIKDEIFIK
jgi:hypothetical protein